MNYLNYIETIFEKKISEIENKRDNGFLGVEEAKYQREKFNITFSQGTVIWIKNGKVIDYQLMVRNCCTFTRKRKLCERYNVVLFFKENELFLVDDNVLKKIDLLKTKKRIENFSLPNNGISFKDDFTREDLRKQELHQAKKKRRELLEQVKKIDSKIDRLTPKFLICKEQQYETIYLKKIEDDKVKITTDVSKAHPYKKVSSAENKIKQLIEMTKSNQWKIREVFQY